MAGGCTSTPDNININSCVGQFRDANFSILSVDLGCVMSSERGYGVNHLVSCKSKSQEVVEAPKHKGSHIMVERNRRKQMTERFSVLRSLMPCFYVKRGDQASIIGGVVDYITELQRVLQSLETKRRIQAYGEEVTCHRIVSASPRRWPLSPRPSIPISPSTPQSQRPYGPAFPPFIAPLSLDTSPSISNHEYVAKSRSSIAEVEVKFGGGNLLLKTCSNRIPGQTTKVIAVLENLSLEVLHVDISVVDETMVNSFTIKIGVDCRLSAEELAQHIQQTFC